MLLKVSIERFELMIEEQGLANKLSYISKVEQHELFIESGGGPMTFHESEILRKDFLEKHLQLKRFVLMFEDCSSREKIMFLSQEVRVS